MSGRVVVTHADGRRTRGYRKTGQRRGPRRPLKERLHDIALRRVADPMATVRMAFALPPRILVASGAHPNGVDVIGSGFIRISSWSADQCCERAQAFLADVAKGHKGFSRTAVFVNAKRPNERYVRHISVTRGAVVLSSGFHEPRIFEAKP
ncbi:MAG: hypothetical protein KGL35_06040 [Bradyrhizobium sp.]|nr:hypothetical protein [Bradyrhizobium sp.]